MPLASGKRLGSYEILALIGAGGMGEVYKARDTRLERNVAIKVLPDEVAADPGFRQRFEREAKTISSLNHPHICTLYDLGNEDGVEFLVMELLEGETLTQRLTRGALPFPQVLRYGIEIAEALDRAHRQGITHRDLKPGNIMLTKAGAKLLDFGLAKLKAESPVQVSSSAATPSPDLLTASGTILGTLQYMAPEQLEAKSVDHRADVFAFGAIVYEMATGKKAFEGASQASLIGAILKDSPHAISSLQPLSPPAFDALIETCLAKDPDERWQSAGDVGRQLRLLQGGSSHPSMSMPAPSLVAPAAPRAARKRMLATGIAVALAAALVPALLYLMRAPAPALTQIRFEIPAPGYEPNGLAVSPDGERIAYAAVTDGVRRIWIRPLGAVAARELPGTENAQGVFWSPDGESLAFFAEGKLKRIAVAGGPATTISDPAPPVLLPGAWSRDGTILLPTLDSAVGTSRLSIGRISAAGGAVTTVIQPESGELGLAMPRSLPDGEHILYAGGSSGSASIYVDSLTAPARVRLVPIGFEDRPTDLIPNFAYAEGFLLYPQGGTLVAQPFDAAAPALRGEARPIAENIGEFSVAAGTLVYREAAASPTDGGAPAQTRRLVWVDRAGQRLGEVGAPAAYRLPALSPDGRDVAVSASPISGSAADIWTIDIERGTTTRLTFDSATDDVSVWSPDGTRIVFNSGRGGVPGIASGLYQRAANGTGSDERLYSGLPDEFLVPSDWSRDGRYLLFGRSRVGTWQQRADLWLLEMAGERTASALIESPFRKGPARFSPDGRWIAYGTNESNIEQIVVQPFPDVGRGKWQVSTRGGRDARWRGDGRELYYIDPDGAIMVVDVQADGDAFEAGAPRLLFDTSVVLTGPGGVPDYFYDVTADGERFLINEPQATGSDAAAAPGAPPTVALKVIVNWAAGLDAR
jgi:Tol biopolymer transport system component